MKGYAPMVGENRIVYGPNGGYDVYGTSMAMKKQRKIQKKIKRDIESSRKPSGPPRKKRKRKRRKRNLGNDDD
eukprot:UN04865